tara:strand:+ start:740 stop:895 length:156 start_codon:yes stop_codon:yes gene_type:complete
MKASEEPIFPNELVEKLIKKYPNNFELGHVMRNHYYNKLNDTKTDVKKIVR